MIEARELVLALSPADFSITSQYYKEGTYQAKRHQTIKGGNAKLSLHAPPRIGVPQFVINLHWSQDNCECRSRGGYVEFNIQGCEAVSLTVLSAVKDASGRTGARRGCLFYL